MTIQVRKPLNPKDIDSDAHLPTESGNFRISVTTDDEGFEHSLLYIEGFSEVVDPMAVSYTHLTLPTIYSV